MAESSDRGGDGRPNVIVILVDDMGYSDIGCYGSEIQTPNLDRLAAGGVRFSSMYNCGRCCPSRAALLTGLYPHQAGVGHMVGNRGVPAYQGYLNDSCVTIAEALSAGGYRSFMSGKWHVGGSHTPANRDEWYSGGEGHPHPLDRGFERFYGMLGGAGSYFRPPTLSRGREFIEPEGDSYYFTDAISDEACSMIDEACRAGDAASGTEAPFFMYVAYTAPHWPLHARREDIERYRGHYAAGWDPLRTARHEALKGMGMLDPHWAISPRDEAAADWSLLSRKRREWEDFKMAVYAAQIDRVDQGVGRIVRKLEEHGELENTLVMFMADNGGCAEFCNEDGTRERYGIPTRDGRMPRVGNRPDVEPGGADTFMSYELPWANASNSPFRLYKCWVHEGGISTPLVVHWPRAVARGAIRHETCHFIDIMPTCLDAAGVAYPDEHEGRKITPVEGESFLPAVRGDAWRRERPVFWEHQGNRAMRDGSLKLVSRFPGRWELYDMAGDRTELDDYATRYRTEVREMESAWNEWAARAGVVDWAELGKRKRR